MGDYSNPAPCVIFDIDGTLANIDHRRPFVMHGNHDWKSFFANMHLDTVNSAIRGLCNMHYLHNWDVFIFTGRPEKYRDVTVDWLRNHGVMYTALYMRPDAEQHLQDAVVKERMYRALGREVNLVVDDRQQVVDMWRANGILCLQCAEGNY